MEVAPGEGMTAHRDHPTDGDREHVTKVVVGRRLRPGKYTVRDHDYRRPANDKLLATASGAGAAAERHEGRQPARDESATKPRPAGQSAL
jgi:type VI secretion system secreted protein VgrG